MSNAGSMRRVSTKIFFDNVDISNDIDKYLLSLSYTDNETDEADDLQIKLCDKDDIWLRSWLNKAIWAASGKQLTSSTKSEQGAVYTMYKVVAATGGSVHSRPGEQYFLYGTLAFGTIITVLSISNGWANFIYSGKNAYVKASILSATTVNNANASVEQSGNDWSIGEAVIANGTPHEYCHGSSKVYLPVTNYEGTITALNLQDNVAYPICVGNLGWFALSDIKKGDTESSSTAEYDDVCKGMSINAVIVRENWNGDGKDEIIECGQFELDSVSASGPPATISIKGTSLPYSSAVRQRKRSKSWENYSLKGIAQEIAAKNNMACLYVSSKNPSFSRVEQYKTSDVVFLDKLCKDTDCCLKCTNNIIVVYDHKANSTVAKKIDRNELPKDTKYQLGTQQNSLYTSCRVSYITSSGKHIEATAYIDDYNPDSDNNQCYELTQCVNSKDEAETLAAATLHRVNKYSNTASFSFPLDPSLVSGQTVELLNYGYWSGLYAISQVRHNVGASASTSQITLRKLAPSELASNLDTNYNTDKSIEQLALEVIRGEWSAGKERERLLLEANYDYNTIQATVNKMLGKE